eukprot:IDg12224t1
MAEARLKKYQEHYGKRTKFSQRDKEKEQLGSEIRHMAMHRCAINSCASSAVVFGGEDYISQRVTPSRKRILSNNSFQ